VTQLRIGIAGLGTVGVGVMQLLSDNAAIVKARTGKDLVVSAVSSRDKTRDRGVSLDGIDWHDDARDLAVADNVDVVLELIGGSDGIAKEVCEIALGAGKDVVTANKALIAHHGAALGKLATNNNAALLFEAAVAGGIPVIKTLREGLAANEIKSVAGILNGTCNYILTEMEKTGRDFADVLEEAQEKGYAEADPSFDVGGIDAAHKLAIIASLAFGVPPTMDDLFIEGIEHVTYEDITFARELGYSVRLIGITKPTENGIERRMHPCLIPEELPLGQVDDVFNAVQINAHPVDTIFLEGRGAGAGPTASSVMADVMDIARGVNVPIFGIVDSSLKSQSFSSMDDVACRYYLRLSVEDKAGVMAAITKELEKADISVETLVQPPHKNGEAAQIVLTTHETTEKKMRAALDTMSALDVIKEKPQLIRIEQS